MRYYLAIDIGASGGRHILGYLSEGKLRLEEVYRFENAPVNRAGSLVWDIDRLFDNVIKGLKICGEGGRIPVSVGIDTWGVDYALLDSAGKAILPVFSYRDGRTAGFDCTSLPVDFNTMYRSTGTQFMPFNTVNQLLCDSADGRLEGAQDMLMLPEYLGYLLTGARAREYTNASTTGLLSARSRDWDYKLIRDLGLPLKLFAPVKEPGFVLGGLKSDVAATVGFDTKVVAVAGHDTASAIQAAPYEELYISSGTWSLLGTVCEPMLTTEAQRYNFTNEGAPFGKIRLLKNIMGLWLIQRVRGELKERYSYAELARLAEQSAVYDWDIDLNRPEFFSPISMIDTIKSACQNANQPVPKTAGEFAHLVFVSLAKCYRRAIIELESITGKSYDSISIIGGGSNNGYLNTLTAKVTGKTVYAGPDEATSAGNLLMQIYADGAAGDNPRKTFKQIISQSFDIIKVKS